jgi:di/tricarboxylate transporter
MNLEITLTLIILAFAVVLFVTEKIRVDVVALMVLGALAITRLVTPEQALSGFSNPAVVTVWAVFVLSGGLSQTGVASIVGKQMLRLAGSGEVRLLVVIMVVSGVMSAFMNNVGVAALFLPVVINMARQTGRPPSKLLMPLAYGTLLGGMLTLIGTPPNILASDALRDAGLPPFRLFDFAPLGGAVLIAGVLYMVLIGRHLLPARDVSREARQGTNGALGETYELQDRLYGLRLPAHSILVGKTLRQSRLGSVLGINVLGVVRNGKRLLALAPDASLHPDDELLVAGRLDKLIELQGHAHLEIEEENVGLDELVNDEIGLAEVSLSSKAAVIGKTLQELDFRNQFGVLVLAIWRENRPVRTNLDILSLQAEDVLLVQGLHAKLKELETLPGLKVANGERVNTYDLEERLTIIRIPPASNLIGKMLGKSRLAEAIGLTVLGIRREEQAMLMPTPDMEFHAEDRLLVKGRVEENLAAIQGLQALEIKPNGEPSLQFLETESIGFLEAVVSPRAQITGKSLRQLNFRERFGITVLAILREGRSYRTDLNNMPLRFGDALLLFGPREKLKLFAREPDFLVLEEEIKDPPRIKKAPLSVLIMAGVVVSVLIGWLPISIAAVVGGTLMVLAGCLNMNEAYRSIEWRAVFLIAGMLPLGIAMENSGAARFLAEGVVGLVGAYGPMAVAGGLFVLGVLTSQVMPNPVVTVLLAPIAIKTAGTLGVSPFALVMAVAVAASASFLSPVGHPANVLIMGPGGYGFRDFIRVGFPLTIVILIVTLLLLPVFWPL